MMTLCIAFRFPVRVSSAEHLILPSQLNHIFFVLIPNYFSPHPPVSAPARMLSSNRIRGLRPPRKSQQLSSWPRSVACTVVRNFPSGLKNPNGDQLYVWRRREDLGIDSLTPGGERIAIVAVPSDSREPGTGVPFGSGNDMFTIQR